jgi:hypothetical protein
MKYICQGYIEDKYFGGLTTTAGGEFRLWLMLARTLPKIRPISGHTGSKLGPRRD